MKKIFFPALFFICSCSAGNNTDEPEITPDTVQAEAESIPLTTDYVYEITELKSGKTFEISQEEYLNSDYIDNKDYTVKEKPIAH